MMYEELIKRLREAPNDWYDADLHYEAADAIEELRYRVTASEATIKRQSDIIQAKDRDLQRAIDAKPQWIPVTERLPETFKHVLVNIPGMTPHPTVQDAFLEKNGMWYSNGFRYSAEEITHWMPLPEAPKEG